MMNQDGKTLVRFTLITLCALVIVGYSLFQARNLLFGPQLTITGPENGETVSAPLITITGTAKNVTYISLNDHQIFIDNSGNFSESLLASPGYNVWELDAKDKFGRIVSKKVQLVFNKT